MYVAEDGLFQLLRSRLSRRTRRARATLCWIRRGLRIVGGRGGRNWRYDAQRVSGRIGLGGGISERRRIRWSRRIRRQRRIALGLRRRTLYRKGDGGEMHTRRWRRTGIGTSRRFAHIPPATACEQQDTGCNRSDQHASVRNDGAFLQTALVVSRKWVVQSLQRQLGQV